MFLMASGRHAGGELDGHQHGVSIKISINLGKKFLSISSVSKFAVTWILAGVCIVTFFLFSDSGLYLLNGFDYYFDLFWMAWLWKPAIGPARFYNPGPDFAHDFFVHPRYTASVSPRMGQSDVVMVLWLLKRLFKKILTRTTKIHQGKHILAGQIKSLFWSLRSSTSQYSVIIFL